MVLFSCSNLGFTEWITDCNQTAAGGVYFPGGSSDDVFDDPARFLVSLSVSLCCLAAAGDKASWDDSVILVGRVDPWPAETSKEVCMAAFMKTGII
jgi:hypothetical protein